MTRAEQIAAAFLAACAEEIAAPKPGNVHAFGNGHGMTAQDFLTSAEAASAALCTAGGPLGARVLGAIRATRRAVGMNTNLGIILLCAPLAMAAEAGDDLPAGTPRICENADLADTEAVFQAIVLASPGGLGYAARHDVRSPARVRLAEAMAEAAGRDRIARQYVTGFADVLGDGLAAYVAGWVRWNDRIWATLATYLHHLAASPDSHIVRKQGVAAAEQVQSAAHDVAVRLLASRDPALLLPELLAWDAALKRDGLNPGTSADLTAATIFAERLAGLHSAGEDG
ncbi:MAG: triphosphoribosyl-dephospho-CoA synthase [Pseudomonadota bacterium]|nr:triphosphoribosyl-dephospho-CoA synthase [Pseudomonadota bacterium]